MIGTGILTVIQICVAVALAAVIRCLDIVVGTSRRTGFDRYVPGSVTEYLVRTAPILVLTVREPDPGTGDIEPSLRESARSGGRYDEFLDTTGNSPTK